MLQSSRLKAIPRIQYSRQLGEDFFRTFSIVRKGHVHVGLVHEDAWTYLKHIFSALEFLPVCYEYGGIWIQHTSPGGTPLLVSDVEFTDWDLRKDPAPSIQKVSFYSASGNTLKMLETLPARGYSLPDE